MFEECLACYPVGSPVLATVLSISSSAIVLSLVFGRCLAPGGTLCSCLPRAHTQDEREEIAEEEQAEKLEVETVH